MIRHVSVELLQWQILIIAAELLSQGSLGSSLKALGERTRAAEALAATVTAVEAEKTKQLL